MSLKVKMTERFYIITFVKLWCIGVASLLVLGIAAFVVAILRVNSGHFVYTLDDPYIHLALARNIGSGHYGINPGEYSSPSSSILWPVMLAPFTWVNGADLIPLILCGVSALLTAWAGCRLLNAWALVGFLILTNSVGLVLTGMEHSLQLLAASIAAIGLARFLRHEEVPWWWATVLVVQPSIRYENLAITICCCACLYFSGKKRDAIVISTLSVLPLAVFSLFLKGIGLNALPSSVLAKDAAGTGNPAITILKNCYHNLRGNPMEVAAMAFLIGWIWFVTRNSTPQRRRIGLTFAAAGVIHLIAGRFGWMARYEPYMIGFLLLGAATFWSESSVRARVVLLLAMLYPSFFYAAQTAQAPYLSHRIYVQQEQMARFVRDYWKDSVAVNDIGWISWSGNEYVLDLWGLASQEARLARTTRQSNWMGDLVDEHHVQLVMIYDHWLPDRPDSWVKIGSLVRLENKTSPDNTVSFYATNKNAAIRLRQQLRTFAKTLPSDAAFISE